jgi:hypothetical protein
MVAVNNVPTLEIVGLSANRCGHITGDGSAAQDVLPYLFQGGSTQRDRTFAILVVQGDEYFVLSEQVHRLQFQNNPDYFGFTVVDMTFDDDRSLTSIHQERHHCPDFTRSLVAMARRECVGTSQVRPGKSTLCE